MTGDARTHALLARILARYPGHDLAATAAATRETIDAALLAQVRAPALIVNGERDTDGAPARGTGAARGARPTPNTCSSRTPAHLPNLDAPHAYNQIMTEFARRHLPAAA